MLVIKRAPIPFKARASGGAKNICTKRKRSRYLDIFRAFSVHVLFGAL